MGQVYRARDPKLNRDVAIKVLPDLFASDPDRLARFQREAHVLASLNHPNIAHIHGFEESNGVRALVMELVEGEDLSQRIARGPIPLDEALPIASQVAEALEAAHEQGIIHRDLKPANIKVRDDGTVKVLDFGLAKALDRGLGTADRGPGTEDRNNSPTITSPAMTMHGVILGTAAYMAPEQAKGRAVDRRADIWAFGCVLYELLTGRAIFARATTTETIAAVLERDVDWSRLPASTPASVRRLLKRCLEKDPRHRLRDAADARLELQDARSDADPPVRASASSRQLAGIGLLAVVLIAAVAMMALLRRSAPAAPLFSHVVRLTTGPDREGAPAISPDGKWVAYLSDAGGAAHVWVKFIAGGEAVNLTAAAGDLEIGLGSMIGGLGISPDGTQIAVAARPRGISERFSTWILPAPLPGLPHKLLSAGHQGMRWSADGRQIVFVGAGSSSGDALYVADADGGNRRTLIEPQNGMHVHWPAWGSDGHIYFLRTFNGMANLGNSAVFRIAVRSGASAEPVVDTVRRAQFPAPLQAGRGLIYSANPSTAEMRLFWRSPDGSVQQPLNTGVGEYAESYVSEDGTALVCTLFELRQALVKVAAKPGATGIVPLTDGYQGDLDPAMAPAGDRLVFSSSRGGNRNLWTARADGTGARPLTSGLSEDDWPSYSPDGRQIVFASDRGQRRSIWIVGADGGPPRKVIDADVIGGPTWSHDGQEIVYSAGVGGGPGLWRVAATGGTPARIPTPAFASDPVVSPAGDVIAYMSTTRTEGAATTDIAFVDRDGREALSKLPSRPGAGFANGLAAWSPDGNRLAVIEQQANLTTRVWLVEPNQKQPYTMLMEFPPGPRVRGLTWTPDGSAVIMGKHDWTSDIVLMQQD
jgi:Tol biopolymer transport system component